jgi:NADPH-dependent 2,4-dienoyl-CoA reductase/sulfur reductase-like enzyme
MPYYIGDVIKDSQKLIARTPEEFAKSGIQVLLKTRAEEIDTVRRQVHLSTGTALPYDHLVIATGAEPILPGIPGQDLEGVFTLRTLQDAVNMKACIQRKHCRKAVILGAGFIAMEMSEALHNLGISVQIIHRDDLPLKKWDSELTARVMETLSRKQIPFLKNTRIQAIERKDDSTLRLGTDHGEIDTDILLIAIGISPNVALAQKTKLRIGESGAIRVDFSQRTSDPYISSVGDCCEVYHRVAGRWVYHPLGDIANKQGRVAGRNIGGTADLFPGIVGAQAFKFFELELAATGLNEHEAIRYGFSPISTVVHGAAASRILAAKEDGEISLKLVADKSSGKLLGAQAIGEKDAVKKIDTVSAALWFGARLDEAGYMDLAYSPPFGGPWDLIHIASRILRQQL